MLNISAKLSIFFSYMGFFLLNYIQESKDREGKPVLTPLYHIHPFHKHLRHYPSDY